MVLLLLSGTVLWFTEYIPWSLRYLRYIAVLVHASSALLTIGLFLLHIYMGVFAERGALDSMVHGDVPLNFVKRYHPGWYKEITGVSGSPKNSSRKNPPQANCSPSTRGSPAFKKVFSRRFLRQARGSPGFSSLVLCVRAWMSLCCFRTFVISFRSSNKMLPTLSPR